MYNNSYIGNSQYNGGQYYPSYTPYMQPKQMSAFSDVMYGTLAEASAYIVPPTKSYMFINRDNMEFYVKSADNMGNSTLETYKYSKTINNPTENISHNLGVFLSREEASNVFATKEDITNINARLEEINKKFNMEAKINE